MGGPVDKGKNLLIAPFKSKQGSRPFSDFYIQGDQDHFYAKEMLISHSILKLHKNP